MNTVACHGRIPLTCLEGIWSKAEELLKTDGAIVSAPGVSSGSKFVQSYSGHRPHLVTPKIPVSVSISSHAMNSPAASLSQVNNFQQPLVTQNMQVTTSPSLYPHPPWSFHGYMPPPSPYSIPPPPSPYSMPLQQDAGSMPPPIVLSKFMGNISVCAGCLNKYPKQPTPPSDLYIRHKEWRTFVLTGSQAPQSRLAMSITISMSTVCGCIAHGLPRCYWRCAQIFILT